MKLKTLYALMTGSNFRLQMKGFRALEPTHRLFYIAAASKYGLLTTLHNTELSFDELAAQFAPQAHTHAAFRAWLHHGCLLKELAFNSETDRYRLRGFLAKRPADPKHTIMAAFFEGLTSLHHKVVFETLPRLAQGQSWSLNDHDGELIARLSEMLQPVIYEVIERAVPRAGKLSMLEVGCGSGALIRKACERNPELLALGLELREDVAIMARQNLEMWSLSERVRVSTGDIRTYNPDERFDLITLYNLIYYFPEAERLPLFKHLAGLLNDGGRVLITTSTKGGTVGTNLLDIWFSATPECGPLPEPKALSAQLTEAGFEVKQARRMMPGEGYFMFEAHITKNPTDNS